MQKIATPQGSIAYRESAGRGAATILIHGNSSSSSVFARQLEGSLGARRRLIALDLPGHGASDDNLAAYSLRGYARAVRALIDALGVEDAHILGWSLGGHIALELAPDLPRARGFVISGTPPLGFPPAMEEAFLPSPAMAFSFEEKLDRQQAAAYAAAGFRPGAADIPEVFRPGYPAHGRARALWARGEHSAGFLP